MGTRVTKWNEYFRSGICISSIERVPLQVILRKFIVDSDVWQCRIGTQNLLNYNDCGKVVLRLSSMRRLWIAVVSILHSLSAGTQILCKRYYGGAA